MLALDVARIEAGLLLIDVDFHGSRNAMIEARNTRRSRWGSAGWSSSDKGPFVGRAALTEEQAPRSAPPIVGLEMDWTAVEALYEAVALAPMRACDGVSRGGSGLSRGRQIGRATSTAWSPTLKKLHRARDDRRAALSRDGTRVEIEVTVEAVRLCGARRWSRRRSSTRAQDRDPAGIVTLPTSHRVIEAQRET